MMKDSKTRKPDDETQPELQYARRTMSISPNINKWIQDTRADFMKKDPNVEYDYTTIANYLMAWGINSLYYDISEKDQDFVDDLVGDRFRLGEYAMEDMLENIRRTQEYESSQMKSKKSHGKGSPVK